MKKKAFTLVELLVVIGIIALLIGILLPALNKARESSRSIKCASNIRQLGVAMQFYINENKGILPHGGDPRYTDNDGDRAARSVGWWDDPALWINVAARNIYKRSYSEMQLDPGTQLPNNLTGNSVFVCPSARDAGTSQGGSNEVATAGGYHQMYGHPNRLPTPNPIGAKFTAGTTDTGGATTASAGGARNIYISYGFNAKIDSTLAGGVGAAPVYVRAARLKQSTEVALLVERRMNLYEIDKVLSDAYGSPGGNALPTRKLNRLKAKWDYFSGRHNKGGYILMADGHVQWLSQRDVLLPPGYNPSTPNGATFNQPGKVIWDPFGPTYP